MCKACIKDTKSFKDLNKPFLFGDINNIDLGTVPEYLPTLTKVKEIIITYVYIYLQVA
jgi:hypothetical protein